MTTNHTPIAKPNFDPSWTWHGRFCDGHFQFVQIDPFHIQNHYDAAKLAAHNNFTGFWTPEIVAELDSEYEVALYVAKARGE